MKIRINKDRAIFSCMTKHVGFGLQKWPWCLGCGIWGTLFGFNSHLSGYSGRKCAEIRFMWFVFAVFSA